MKKKNLIILLVFPFLLSIFCIITVNTTYNRVDVDISYIDWKYNDMEGFQISEKGYLLEAEGVNQRHYKVSSGNALVWQVKNKNTEDPEPCAEIYESGKCFYLRALKEGEVIVTCSNQKGNIHRQMTGVIYKDAAILFYPTVGGSQTNIDSTIYYGEYDHSYGNAASIDMTLTVIPSTAKAELMDSVVGNVEFNRDDGSIHIGSEGDASVTLSLASGRATPITFSFTVVDDGVNVYTYDDLLNCTNLSTTGGDIVVLRKSFESLANAYLTDNDGNPISTGLGFAPKANNVACFGNYNAKTKSFDFSEEVYHFPTTYSRAFIDQWNAFVSTNSNYSPITDRINVGLRVQKDFYGNGYTLNLHNLTYPYSYALMTTEEGEVVRIPQLTASNLFRGPLKMYTLGDPNNIPPVSLYGQDNVGMYIDGDDITVNDVNIKNCDFGDRIANLATVGTVVEAHGDRITIKNSRLSNGKNVLRSFSSMDLTVSNCLLSNSQNFLFVTGANEYLPIDTEATVTLYDSTDGTPYTATLGELFQPGATGDTALNTFIISALKEGSADRQLLEKSLQSIRDAFNAGAEQIRNDFKGSTQIEDCFFYRSGISAIAMESLFNSPFLESISPSIIQTLLNIQNDSGKKLVPYTATHVSGISYPVRLNIAGDTRFYDYKVLEDIELEGLIEENMSAVAKSVGITQEINIDAVFPLKTMIRQVAGSALTYNDPNTGTRYINIPVAYYGGGLNLSTVTVNGYDNKDSISGDVDVNLLNYYLNLPGGNTRGLIWKTVVTVTGFEPFSFRFVKNGAQFGETPKITDLIANAKGA